MARPAPPLAGMYGPNAFGQIYIGRKHAKVLTGTHTYAQLREYVADKNLKREDEGYFKGTNSRRMPPQAESRTAIGNEAAERSIRPAFPRRGSSIYEAGRTLEVRSGGPWQPWFNTRYNPNFERGASVGGRNRSFAQRIGPETYLGRAGWAGAKRTQFSDVLRPQ
jgi:hypothetical protein